MRPTNSLLTRLYIPVSATLLGIGVSLLSIRIQGIYYSAQPFWTDHSYGMLHMADTYFNWKKCGLAPTVRTELSEEIRSPVFTLLPLLINPGLLKSTLGHMVWHLPLFVLFATFLGYEVKKTANSSWLGISVMTLFITSLVHVSPYFGIAFNVPDTSPGYLLGIAGLAFLRWKSSGKNLWLILMSLSISFSVLLRYSTSVYAFILFAPLVLINCYINYKKNKGVWSTLVKPLILVTVIVSVLCGFYVFKAFGYYFNYYSYWSVADRGTASIGMWESLKSIVTATAGFFGLLNLALFVLIFIILLFIRTRLAKQTGPVRWESFWLGAAVPSFLLLYLQPDGNRVSSAFLAYFPLLFVGAFGWMNYSVPSFSKQNLATGFVFMVCILSLCRSYYKSKSLVTTNQHLKIVRSVSEKISAEDSDLTTRIGSFDQPQLADAISLDLWFNHNFMLTPDTCREHYLQGNTILPDSAFKDCYEYYLTKKNSRAGTGTNDSCDVPFTYYRNDGISIIEIK